LRADRAGRRDTIGTTDKTNPLRATTIINCPIERIGQYHRRDRAGRFGSGWDSVVIGIPSLTIA
jgi:hypothetical protein